MIIRIPDADSIPVPYELIKDNEVDGLYNLHNLYNGNDYWVHLGYRTCDCASYEFVISDNPGSYCKHLRAIAEWRKKSDG